MTQKGERERKRETVRETEMHGQRYRAQTERERQTDGLIQTESDNCGSLLNQMTCIANTK